METERTLLHTDTYNASKAIYRVGPAIPAAPAVPLPDAELPVQPPDTPLPETAPPETEAAPSQEVAPEVPPTIKVFGVDGGPGVSGN